MSGFSQETIARHTLPGKEREPLRRLPFLSGDRVFEALLALLAAAIAGLGVLIAWELWRGSSEARHAFGFGFITGTEWDPVDRVFGAAPYIYGTLVTSIIALLLAAPIGVGTAIFLTELAPGWLRAGVGFLVEMLAAIPSVIYGLWALFVLVPVVRADIEPALARWLGATPFFQGPAYGVGMLSAILVLTIMIVPTVTSISRAVLERTPVTQREGAYALGATRWEVIWSVTLPYARSGIAGALILALGRALGETMAVTMVIGNRAEISLSLFSLSDTMASVIANQFSEASYALYTSVLVEIGLLLFVVTVLLNLGARLLVGRAGHARGGAR